MGGIYDAIIEDSIDRVCNPHGLSLNRWQEIEQVKKIFIYKPALKDYL